ncbi:MAG TPA: response regulator transcription factor [Burkholderiaceae bacterium]|nr:response regulator transcription factor [Burkholderiaceae bacterium]
MTTRRPPIIGEAVVFVVDDDLSVREALSSLLRSVGLRVETFGSAAEFLQQLGESARGPACLVLDVRMPGLSGLDLQAELNRLHCRIPVIFITGHGDIPMTVRAMKAGAAEFLPKPFRDQDLLDAIFQSLERDRQARRERESDAGIRERYDTLTGREREVLALLMKGLRNKQTADQLGISEVTVKVHRHNVMEKMRAGSLPALIDMVSRLRLPDADRGPR